MTVAGGYEVEGNDPLRADHRKVIIALNCCPQRLQKCRQVALIYIKDIGDSVQSASLLIHLRLHDATLSLN